MVFYLLLTGERYANQALSIQRDMGDGAVIRSNFTNTNNNEAIFFPHTYNTSAADVKINFTVSNLVSRVSLVNDIMTQEYIDTGTMTCTNDRLIVGDTSSVSVEVDARSNAWITVEFGDGASETSTFIASTQITHLYIDPGNFSVKAHIFNNVSHVNVSCDNIIMVRNNLRDLTIDVPEVTSLPEGNFTVTIGSSHAYLGITCTFNIGGIIESTVNFPLISAGNSQYQYFNVSSLSTEEHEVTVVCNDGVTNTSSTTSLAMVENVRGLRMTLSKNITEKGDPYEVQLEVSSGSNMTFVISFGNGDLELSYAGLNTSKIFFGSYTSTGTFTIRGSAVNGISSSTVSAVMRCIKSIDDTTFNHHSIDLYSGRIFYGTGNYSKMYNLNNKIVVSANITEGSNLKYSWEFKQHDSTKIIETKVPYLAKKFNKPGNVTITCTVTNGIKHKSDSMEVEMLEPVFLTQLSNDGPQKAQRNVTLKLGIKNPTDSTCILMYLQSQTILYGASICMEIALSHSFGSLNYNFTESTVSESIEFVEFYSDEGSFSVRATVFNWVSRSYAVSQVSHRSAKYCLLCHFIHTGLMAGPIVMCSKALHTFK